MVRVQIRSQNIKAATIATFNVISLLDIEPNRVYPQFVESKISLLITVHILLNCYRVHFTVHIL